MAARTNSPPLQRSLVTLELGEDVLEECLRSNESQSAECLLIYYGKVRQEVNCSCSATPHITAPCDCFKCKSEMTADTLENLPRGQVKMKVKMGPAMDGIHLISQSM